MEPNAKALFDYVFPSSYRTGDWSPAYEIVDGFYIERDTGIVKGRHLELDNNTGH